MDRSHDGHMDWQYQDRGPLDATSPFTQVARGTAREGFASPSKPTLNAFAKPQTPSRPPPTASTFSPHLPTGTTATPFRNPAFTTAFATPRRRFDDPGFSEASGPEDSPALTDTSYGNDTPEVDRLGDITMGGMALGPLRVDKAHRYGPSRSARKHAPGKGELRSHRDHDTDGVSRKRTRKIFDRDVGSRNRGRADSDDNDADSADSHSAPGRSQSKGMFASIAQFMDMHPNAPHHFQAWFWMLFSTTVTLSVAYLGWAFYHAVITEVSNKDQLERMLSVSKAQKCRKDWIDNKCEAGDIPALQSTCLVWYDCMMQDTESTMTIRNTVQHMGVIINDFVDVLNLKALGVIFGSIALLAVLGRQSIGSSSNNQGTVPTNHAYGYPVQQDRAHWAPRTPRKQGLIPLEDETDTDASPPKLLPPSTPFGRRSPGKRGRSQSPVKYYGQTSSSRAM